MQPTLEIVTHDPLAPGRTLPLYDRVDHSMLTGQDTHAHFPSVMKYTPVQLACLPDARPEQAPTGFRYRPPLSEQVFEVTLLGYQAVDAAYVLEREQEWPVPLRALSVEVRRVNYVNNWARDFTIEHLPARLELIHTEVSEAYRATSPDERTAELGDVVIRTLDLLALLERTGHAVAWEDLNVYAGSAWFGAWEPLLLRLHDQTDLAMEAYRKIPDLTAALTGVAVHLMQVIGLAWSGLMHLGAQDPTDILTNLVRRNSVRGLNHGGRRL